MSSSLEQELAMQLKMAGIKCLREFRFAPPRRWRFDFFFPWYPLGIEVEGGSWSGGRHTRGKGFEQDCEKYNAAAEKDIHVLRYTAKQIRSGAALSQIERMVKS